MSPDPIKITALTIAQLAQLLSSSAGKRLTEDEVRQVANDAGIVRADGTLSLIEYTAYLAREVVHGRD